MASRAAAVVAGALVVCVVVAGALEARAAVVVVGVLPVGAAVVVLARSMEAVAAAFVVGAFVGGAAAAVVAGALVVCVGVIEAGTLAFFEEFFSSIVFSWLFLPSGLSKDLS